MNDAELLSAYEKSGSESAFGKLVERYIGMVYGLALRRTGDRQLAEEVSQNVFTILARKAHTGFKARPVLANWLYQTTLFQASAAYRKERNRQRLMEDYGHHHENVDLNVENESHQIRAILDEALGTLPSKDRDVVFLRFFECQNYREIGTAIGKSEEASRKQTSMALEKLAKILRRNGVVLTTTALATSLSAQLAESAPHGVAAAISQSALANAPTLTSTILAANPLHTMASAKTKIGLTVAILSACLPLSYEWIHQDDPSRQTHDPPSSIKTSPLVSLIEPFQRPGESITDLMRRILSLENSAHQQAEIQFLVRHANSDEIAEALNVLLTESPDDQDHRLAFLEAWGESHPSEALAHAGQGTDEGTRRKYEDAVMKGWTRSDPESSLDHLAEIPSGERRTSLINDFFENLTEVSRTKALAIALQAPEDLLHTHHIDQIFHNWARSDLEGALEVHEQIENALFRDRALQRILTDMAQDSLTDAFHYADNLEDDAARRRHLLLVASEWRDDSPMMVAELANSIDDEKLRDQFIDKTIGQVSPDVDAGLKVGLIDALDQSELTEKHLPNYLTILAWRDPRAATD
jgi:RNA polymerase sigma factor (sigma-70 family)